MFKVKLRVCSYISRKKLAVASQNCIPKSENIRPVAVEEGLPLDTVRKLLGKSFSLMAAVELPVSRIRLFLNPVQAHHLSMVCYEHDHFLYLHVFL